MNVKPRGWRASAIVLAVILACASTRAQRSTPPLPTGAISGVVIDGVTGAPIDDAIVSLDRRGADTDTQRVAVDSRGRFVFRNLAAHDDYLLSARSFSHAATFYGWTSPNGSSVRAIPLADGQWINSISMPMWQLGAIDGHVFDERGEPVVGVVVRAFSRTRLAGNTYWAGGPLATTDDRGAFRIADLDPRQYVVGVLSVQSTVLASTPESNAHLAIGELESGAFMGGLPGHIEGPAIDVDRMHRLAMTNFATPPPPGGAAPRAYAPTFYPNATSVVTASPIEIGYGDEKIGIEIQLRPVPAVRVSGTLQGGDAGALASTLLRLMPAGSEALGAGSEVATTVVEPGGAFTFLNVPAGEYTLMAQPSIVDFSTSGFSARIPVPPGYSGSRIGIGSFDGAPGVEILERSGIAKPSWARQTVVVGTDNITSLVVPLRPSPVIRGHIVYPEGRKAPPPEIDLQLVAEPASGDPSLGEAVGHLTSDGDFAIEGCLTGPYFIRADVGIVSVVVGNQDVRDTGIDVSSGADINGVVITLSNKLATVTGLVAGAGLTSQAAVILFPADRAKWVNYGWRSRRVISVLTDAKGAFKLDGLVEGEYLVVAVNPSLRDEWADPAFLEAAASRATALSLKWGDTRNINLVIAGMPGK